MDEVVGGLTDVGPDGLSIQEFQDWVDALSEQRHAQTIEALCKLMFDTEYDGETLPQFRLRVKNTVLAAWAHETEVNVGWPNTATLDAWQSTVQGRPVYTGERLTLQEFHSWQDTLSTKRYEEVTAAVIFFPDTEHKDETPEQLRLRIKLTLLEKWAAEDMATDGGPSCG